MRETQEDIDWLQRLLDESYAGAGVHLREIHTQAARLHAEDLVRRLDGMQVSVVATVSGDGRPFSGPVDSFLYRGRLHFGTDRSAVRARHLRANPALSATHVRGEGLVVTVHGVARSLDLLGADGDFLDLLRRHYGRDADWLEESVQAGNPYWAIEPDRMFAADMGVHLAG